MIVFIFIIQRGTAQTDSKIAKLPETDSLESRLETELSMNYYALPHESDYLMPIVYFDFKSFHVEARYNYEDRKTASVFAGYRFETGNKLNIGITPIVGVVFGNTNGFAPGILLDLTFGKLDFYSENEYVVDNTGKENNYFYTWTEFAISPVEKLRMGISAGKTKIYQMKREFQRGIFTEYSAGNFTLGLNYFNPFSADYYFIAIMNYQF